MSNEDFLDFKAHSEVIQNIPIRSIWWPHYEKSKPLSFFYRTDFNQSFQEVDVRRKPDRPSNSQPLTRAYKKKIPVSALKYKDIFTICDKLMIPRENHAYYRGLKTDESVRYALSEPDND